jgi:hypothetical protein
MPTLPTDGEPLDESAPDGATAVDGPDLAYRADGVWRRAAPSDDPRLSDARAPTAHTHSYAADDHTHPLTWLDCTLSTGVSGWLRGAVVPGTNYVLLDGRLTLGSSWVGYGTLGLGVVASMAVALRTGSAYVRLPVACSGVHPMQASQFVAHAVVQSSMEMRFERLPTAFENKYGPGGSLGFTTVECNFSGGYRKQ